jgi:fatty acid amide hydrolase
MSRLPGLGPLARFAAVSALQLAGQQWMARMVNSARPRSADEFWLHSRRKNEFIETIVGRLRELQIDAILCPPHALPAMQHSKGFDLLPAGSYAFLFNLLGFPAGTLSLSRVRKGEDRTRPESRDKVLQQAHAVDRGSVGMPVAVQVAALPWRDDVALAVMAALEEAFRDRADYPGKTVAPA